MSTKYKVGDTVTVEHVIIAVDEESGNCPVKIRAIHWPLASTIKGHTPKQREFKPGDMVTWGGGHAILEFIAERDGYAIMWSTEFQQSYRQQLLKLRHADEVQ
jgi:hypothetical protein